MGSHSGVNFMGGVGGAASGAQMGSMLGPWGAAAGGVAGGVMGLLSKKKQGAKMMAPGVLYAKEDAWAEGGREQNFNYISNMMDQVQSGVDPMQARRDQQLQQQLTGIRRDMFGTPGDRNQSISGMGQQQMAMFGSNPAAMAAQRKKDRNSLQFQMDDVRQRISDAGTNYMEKASFFAPEMANQLKTGPKVAGTYGPMMMPGSGAGGVGGSGMDMGGVMKGLGALKGSFGSLGDSFSGGGMSKYLPGGYRPGTPRGVTQQDSPTGAFSAFPQGG